MKVTINGAVLLSKPEWPDVDFAVEQSRNGILAKIERVGEPSWPPPSELEQLPNVEDAEDG